MNIPVIKPEEAIYYVSEADIIEFISINANMEWNECCNFVRINNITSNEGRIYWEKKYVLTETDGYNTEAKKWIELFFKAHPFMERIMIVFDD